MKTKHRKWILMILMVCMAFILSGCTSSKYKEAQELFAAQNYAEAQKIFTEIEDHEDSGKYLAYIAAVKEADAGRFAQASEAFAALSGFQDSDKLSIYYAARQAETEERYEDADALYQQLGTFMDSATRKNSLPALIVNRDQRNRAKLYAQGQTALGNGDYETAIAAFAELNNYEESSKYLMYARAMKMAEEGQFELAISSFASLKDFSDSDLQVTYYTARQAEAEQRYEDAELLYKSVATFRDSMERMAKLPDMILDRDFDLVRSVIMSDEKELDANFDPNYLFTAVYSDSETRMMDQFDQLGDDALAAGLYENAFSVFKVLNAMEYAGAYARMQDCRFAWAENEIKNGNYAAAEYSLEQLYDEEYAAAEALLKECYYHLGLDAEAKENYASAHEYYTWGIPHANSAEKAARFENEYAVAETLLAEEKFDEAVTAFATLKNYKDATDRILETYYKQGEALLAAGKWEAASAAFTNAGTYSDASTRILETYYKQGEALLAAENEAGAIAVFKKAEPFSNAKERWQMIYYAQAERHLAAGEWDKASAAFTNAGTYSDASTRILETYYKQGEALLAAENEAGAIEAFKKAEPFSNAKERWQMIYYAQAERYLATEERTAAFDAFVKAGEYSDASERMKELFQKEIKSYDVWYMNAPLDTVVEVETYVQAKQSWWDNKATLYTQNEEGAYSIYEMAISEEDYNKLVPGTKILVKGYKAEWAGGAEIVDATYEILDGKWIASPKDFTDMLGSEELINYQNQLAAFKGMTVEAIEYKNGEPGDDIYVTLSLNGQKYDFCVERYLTGPETEVYTAVGGLHAGDVVDVEGFMYWYNGINTHITKIYKH